MPILSILFILFLCPFQNTSKASTGKKSITYLHTCIPNLPTFYLPTDLYLLGSTYLFKLRLLIFFYLSCRHHPHHHHLLPKRVALKRRTRFWSSVTFLQKSWDPVAVRDNPIPPVDPSSSSPLRAELDFRYKLSIMFVARNRC